MKIVAIFAVENNALYSVQYDDKDTDELSHFMNSWNDLGYLQTYFKENEKYLTSGFFGNLSVDDAIEITLNDAERLENLLYETAIEGKSDSTKTLQTIFKPLFNNETNIPSLQKTKLKGVKRNSWLRIYAIRIAANTFVISGGGIKLTHLMQENKLLTLELQKLEITKNYLREIGILDEDDYELLEIL
ncbi:MAG: hypothetical protein WCJ61_05330 [Paludibacter sp.]